MQGVALSTGINYNDITERSISMSPLPKVPGVSQ